MGTLYRYHHLGIPTADDVAGGTYLPHLKMTVSDDTATPYGIQWMRFDEDCPLPHLVKRVPHVAFEVDDLKAAIRGKKVIIQPNQPSPGVTVAFIEEAGAPIEFLEIARGTHPRRRSTRVPVKFTEKQGQYLAFIESYMTTHGRAPAEADLERFFRTTPPSIHQMILTLEAKGLISRVPGQPRSIHFLVKPDEIPRLKRPR